jgi:hypothetical protein
MMPLVERRGRGPRGASGLIRAILPAALFGLAFLWPTRAVGQLTVDQVPIRRTVPIREQIEQEMESSRLTLGPFRVTPLITVDNAGYDGNVYNVPNEAADREKIGDWTATVGAGGRAILPMGSKLYLRLVAVPQYIWYSTLEEFNTWGGDFSASFLALGNRLSFAANGAANKGSTILSSETQANVIETTKEASGNFEVDLTRALSFVAGGEIQEDRYAPGGSGDPIDVEKFNRTDAAVLTALRLRLNPSLIVSAGVQATQSEFEQDLAAESRDNQTLAYLGGLRFDRPKFYVNLAGGYRKARAYNDSSFPDYGTTVGSYFASWYAIGPLELQAYGHRRPVYSRSAFDKIYIETRNGGGVRVHIGPQLYATGYAQIGTNAYPFSIPDPLTGERRVDDAWSYGGGVSFLLGATVLQARVTQNVTTPSAGGPDRTVFRFTTGITFNGEWTK